tara:strand:+ start:63 stop:710 length:648 start_codon:yes stop_codon:yes gene_type:complete
MPQTIIAFIIGILFFFTGLAQQSSLSVDHFNTESENLVVNGYDVVSYFSESKPVKGKQTISTDYQGLLVYFSSQENKRKFLDDPEKYLPKYGGWCAYAIGNSGKKVDVDPFSYSIKNGESYLFYKSYFNDTREKWIQNHKELKTHFINQISANTEEENVSSSFHKRNLFYRNHPIYLKKGCDIQTLSITKIVKNMSGFVLEYKDVLNRKTEILQL